MTTRVLIPIAAALAVMPVHAAASAIEADDWNAWYGCWRAVDSSTAAASMICVLPGEDATSVRIATIADGVIAEETVVRADGVARPIEDGGCSGSESATFSADSRRIYTRSELACGGLGRVTTGVLAMVSEVEWVDAQALTVNGQHAVRSIRYRAADPSDVPAWVATELPQDQRLAQETARMNAATPLDVDAVIEASQHVAPPAVEALLAERQQGFGLNADRLARLDAAGVPASTIDVMIALSYPTKFAVEPQRQPAGSDLDGWSGDRNAARVYMDDCYDPYWMGSRSSCYGSRYGYGYNNRRGVYGYSPYGYDPYGWNYGGRPIVIVTPGDNDPEPRGGQLVKGRGYTRNGASRGTANPRGVTERTRETPVRATGSTTTTTRSTPSTSSGSSSEPKRTAKPRGGGGNN